MLSVASIYKNMFSHLKIREPQYKYLLTNEDWVLAQEIYDKLKLICSITKIFFGTKYPTTNEFFSKNCEIRSLLSQWKDSSNKVIHLMA